PASELPTQEPPLIEEPDDQELEPPQQVENPQPNSECVVKEANPSEKGMEFLFCACVGGGPCFH
ncbi:hypothetical protein U9M48_035288, partial [Paspalum notatum var. saurae]